MSDLIALVSVHEKVALTPHADGTPLNLCYLRSVLNENGYSSVIINPHGIKSKSMQELSDEVRSHNPALVGISSTSGTHKEMRELCKLLKDYPTIGGGYYSLLGKQGLEEADGLDVLFKGEFEERGPEVIRRILTGQSLENIPGLLYRNDGQIIDTGRAPVVHNLDKFMPDVSYLAEQPADSRILKIYSSRNCENHCTFCAAKTFYGEPSGSPVRHISAERLNKFIQTCFEEYAIKYIQFTDENFLCKPGRLRELSTTLRSHGIRIDFMTRADTLINNKEEIYNNRDVIYDIGIGIESFVQNQLDRWNKKTTVRQNMDAITFLMNANIPIYIATMFADKRANYNEINENLLNLTQAGYLLMQKLNGDFSVLNPISDIRGAISTNAAITDLTYLLLESTHNLRILDRWNESIRQRRYDLADALYDGSAAYLLCTIMMKRSRNPLRAFEEKQYAEILSNLLLLAGSAEGQDMIRDILNKGNHKIPTEEKIIKELKRQAFWAEIRYIHSNMPLALKTAIKWRLSEHRTKRWVQQLASQTNL